MSDFLTRLAARAVGVAPVVQPRLPSLFESGGQRERPIVEVDVQRETPAIGQNNRTISAEAKQAGTINQAPPHRIPFGEPRPAIKTEIDHRSHPPVIPRTPRTKPTIEPAQPFTASSELTQSSRATIEATDKVASTHIVEHVRETKSEPPVVDREHESEWPLIKPKVRQLISDRLSEFSTPPPRDEKNGARISGSLAFDSDRRAGATAQIRPAEILVREPAVISETAAPINVTIGRVDVRAVITPASQTTRVAKDVRPQTASLEEYLNKRSGVNR
jgi:hypothetical protein